MQVKLLNSYAAFDYEIINAGNSMFVLKIWRKDKEWEPATLLLGKFLQMTIDEFTEFLMEYNNSAAANQGYDERRFNSYKDALDIMIEDFIQLAKDVDSNLTEQEQEKLFEYGLDKFTEKTEEL